MRRRSDCATLADQNFIHRTRSAAEQARRSDTAVIHQKRGFRLTAQQPDLVVDPKPATMPPSTTRAFAQGKPVEQDRVMLFEDLNGLGLRDPDTRTTVCQPVCLPPTAVPAAAEQVHDVMSVLFGIVAAEAKIAAGPGRRREEALRDRLPHRQKYRLHDALCYF